MRHRLSSVVLLVGMLGPGTGALAQEPAAAPAQPLLKRTESGKGLVIPEDQARLGTPYYTATGGGSAKQVSFTSEALNAKFYGHSAGVIGYAIAGPTDNPAALKAGLWAMPVKSLDSGNKLRDKHTSGPDWLDAARFPDVVFVLKEVRDIKLHKETSAGKSFACTLAGDLTLHGVTRPLSVPDTILAFAAASDTAQVKGERLVLRCKYTVKLSEFGISNDYTTTLKSVADDIGIDQTLILSTVPPEQQPKSEGEGAPAGK